MQDKIWKTSLGTSKEMSFYMVKYQNKYIRLSDASTISGYTTQELKNFCKIGLIPFKKQKNKLYIRFDAFEKINQTNTAKPEAGKKEAKAVTTPTIKSLIPFTMPHPTMVKALETVAFAAALVMTLHVTAMPNVGNRVLDTIDRSGATVAYMADTMSGLLQTGVAVPLEIGSKIASISTLSATEQLGTLGNQPMVAGISAATDVDIVTTTSTDNNIATNTLIRIADSAQDFSNLLNRMSRETYNLLVSPYHFENLDSGIQAFFRL